MCPGITSTRNGPPGRASKSSAVPHQDDCSAGSTSSFHTVSGRAAIVSSRSTVNVSVALSILPLLSFGIVLQRVEPLAPESVEERLQVGEPLRARTVEASRAVPTLVHETRLLQNAEVLRDRRPRDVELRGDLPRGELPLADELEDPAAAGLGDCTQCSFHRALFKRLLT